MKKDRHFRIDEGSDLDKFLSQFDENFQAYAIEFFDKLRRGELVTLDDKELDKELKRARLGKIRKEIVLLDFKIKKEAIESGYSPTEALEISKGNIKVIDSEQVSLLLHKESKEKIPEKSRTGLRSNGFCNECGHIHLIFGNSTKQCSHNDCLCFVRSFEN